MKWIHLPVIAAGMFAAAACATQQVNVVIEAARPGPVINKNIYGQFAEHLGSGIYGGLWVGPDSTIPNTRGFRNDVVGALKALHVPLVRWPGGCFADEYHWRDGIGPRAQAAGADQHPLGRRRGNNAFGTHEFIDLVELIGAEPTSRQRRHRHAAGDGGLGRVHDGGRPVDAWPNCARRNGRADAVQASRFFGVGNETWGCGGNMTSRVLRRRVPPLRDLRPHGAGSDAAADRRGGQRRRYRVDR